MKYLIIDSDGASIFKFISKDCISLFTYANKMLDEVRAKIMSSTITLRELLLMKEKRDHMKKLITVNVSDEQEDKHIQQVLEEKLGECALFLQRKEYLGQLCQHVKVPVKGMEPA
jgi:parvulin-like peptidyl-prolyl isomerase